MSERQQQIAEALHAAACCNDPGAWDVPRWHKAAAAVEPFLVAAERAGYERGYADGANGVSISPAVRMQMAENMLQQREARGYERCKQDASTAIKAQRLPNSAGTEPVSRFNMGVDSAAAVVAALGQQQEASGHLPSVQVGTNATGANAMQRVPDTREGSDA